MFSVRIDITTLPGQKLLKILVHLISICRLPYAYSFSKQNAT